MAVKSVSTRASICGRGAGARGGRSAVEQSSYIGRTEMYSEYDCKKYYPKYSEDLVHNEVMLPKNAPKEYMDPAVLWNSVEMIEKSSNAQLARVYKVSLPNEWSYELATDVMREYIQRNFVSKGMCVQFAIHDSENKMTGERNLHCHMLMTLRGIDENGKWLPKSKKEYLLDENGERIPLIDKKTGKQKVDSSNRKQWKCKTIQTNDWNNQENAKIWRKDLVDTINYVNEKIGIKDIWEHRSFKERGLDILPQIHLGEKASALERAGKHSARGDINREIIKHNTIIMKAKESVQSALENLEKIRAVPVEIVKAIKNEILLMIREVVKRNNRLSLPIIKGEYLNKISNRSSLQDPTYMERFVADNDINSFEELSTLKVTLEPTYNELKATREGLFSRIERLENLLEAYEKYKPYIEVHKESMSLRGWAKRRFDSKHIPELSYYDVYKKELTKMLYSNEKITPMKWRSELKAYREKLEKTREPYSKVVIKLASIEVLKHNKEDLQRMIENERRLKEKSLVRTRGGIQL